MRSHREFVGRRTSAVVASGGPLRALRRLHRAAWVVVLLAISVCGGGRAPRHASAAPATTGVLEGIVIDEAWNAPASGVTVQLAVDDGPGPSTAAITGEDGRYRIAGLSPGTYRLELFHGNRRQREPNVEIRAGATISVVSTLADRLIEGSEPFCISSAECAAWQVCSVELGDCGSALAPFDLCSGVCRPTWVGTAARVAGVVKLDDGAEIRAAFGLEVLLRGRVALAVDRWTDGSWRLGAAVWLYPHPAFATSLRVDGLQVRGRWSPALAARVEWSPSVWPFRGADPLEPLSVLAEVGAVAADDRLIFVTFGVGGWLTWPFWRR